MLTVHPTESAGTGKAQTQSFYIKKSDIPDDIIFCGMCGFPVDLRQHPSGDSYGAVGNPIVKTETGNPRSPGVSFTNVYGDPQPTAGCPLCGTMNPQASGRGQSGFDKTVRTILGL